MGCSREESGHRKAGIQKWVWAELGKGLCEASSLEGVEDAVWDIDCSSRSLKTALNIISNPSHEKSRRLLREEPSWRLRGRRLSRDTPDQAQSSCPLSFHTAPDSPQPLQPPNDMEGHRQGPGRPPWIQASQQPSCSPSHRRQPRVTQIKRHAGKAGFHMARK